MSENETNCQRCGDVAIPQSGQAIEWLREHACFGCESGDCASEVSYRFEQLRITRPALNEFQPQLICEGCYDYDEDMLTLDQHGDFIRWCDLERFDPFARLAEDRSDLAGCDGLAGTARAAVLGRAKVVVEQWDNHDQYRQTEADKSLIDPIL